VLITLHPSALLRMTGDDRDAAYAEWLADLRNASKLVRKRASPKDDT
jgi:DNA polymerase